MPCVSTYLRKTEFGGFTRGFVDALYFFFFLLNLITLPLSFTTSFFFLAIAAVFPSPACEIYQLFGATTMSIDAMKLLTPTLTRNKSARQFSD